MQVVANVQRRNAGWGVSLGTWLLAVCLLGTQWLGLTHAIEHRSHMGGVWSSTQAGEGTAKPLTTAATKAAAVEHNCALFDALALSSCAGTPVMLSVAPPQPLALRAIAILFPVFLAVSSPYQSRAPPEQPV